MTTLNEQQLAQLAREMAYCIRNHKLIFADFGITEEDYYEISKNEYYQRIKEHITQEWNSTVSTGDRVKLQGQAGTEVLLPVAISRALVPTEPLTSVIEALKLTAKIGGLSETKVDPKASAERFVITINLGADVDGQQVIEHYNKSIEINPNDVDLKGVDHGQT